MDLEEKAYDVLGPIWGRYAPFLGQKEIFKNILHCNLYLPIVPHHCAKFQKNSFEQIPRSSCKSGWVQFGFNHCAKFPKGPYS